MIATGAAANAATINSPLAELDAAIKKNEYAKAAAPGVNDDSGDGYTVGSVWIDTTNDKAYICADATVGAAIWYWLNMSSQEILLGPQDFYIVAGGPAQGVIGKQPTWRLDDGGTETIGAAMYYPGPTGGSSIKITVIWCMESATVNNVYFTVYAASITDGEDGDVAGSSSTGAKVVPGTAKYIKISEFTCSNTYAAGELIQVAISRVGGSGFDTAAGDCHILGAVLRFE